MKIYQSTIEAIRLDLANLPPKVVLPRTLHVTFGGELGDRFCREFVWVRRGLTDQVPDAVKAIAVNYPGLQEYLYRATQDGQMFAVMIDGQWCADDLDFACYLSDAKTVHIEPLPQGEKGGNLIKAIAGVVLIGVGIAAGATGVLGIPGGTLILMGGSMLASAALGALLNRPITKKDDDDDNRERSYFSGSTQNALDKVIPRPYGTSTDEIPGSTGINAVPIGARIPAHVVSFDVSYVETQEEDD